MLYEVLSIISEPAVNSNWSYSPQMLNLSKIWQFFVQCDLEICLVTFKNNRATFLGCFKLCASFRGDRSIQIGVTVQKQHSVKLKIGHFLSRVNLGVWRVTLKNNRAPLLHHFKLCASFHNHQRIETRVTFRKRPIWGKIGDLWFRVTLKFDRLHWKTIGHLFYATSSFAYHFTTIGNSNSSYCPEMSNLGQNRRFFVPCDLEIWRRALKDNRAPLLCYFKLCASFYNHRLHQTRVTVRKRLHGVLTSVTWTFDLWFWPFAWTSLLSMVISSENFIVIRWE